MKERSAKKPKLVCVCGGDELAKMGLYKRRTVFWCVECGATKLGRATWWPPRKAVVAARTCCALERIADAMQDMTMDVNPGKAHEPLDRKPKDKPS